MSSSRSSPFRALLIVALALLAGGCARGVPDVGPRDIPRLEKEAAASPGDLEKRTELGVAYFRAERYESARATLGRTVDEGAENGAAFLYLGLANEELENWSGARDAYSRYLDLGRFDPLKDELRSRLTLIVRRELEAEAREALAREEEITSQPPRPRTLAVFPLRFVGDDPELEPLQLAMADMLITDLSLVGSVTVLERTQVNTLLREMALTEAGYTSPETGARAGRLLRAEHVVQGAMTPLGQEGLRVDASILAPEDRAEVAGLTDEGRLEAIFDVEKEIVFGVLDALAIEITPAEREAIDENRAENLLSFLAYGRGLQAMEDGRYGEATSFFEQAVQLDPDFGRARTEASEARDLEEASGTTTQGIARRGTVELPGAGPAVTAADAGAISGVHNGGTDDLLAQTSEEINPSPTGRLLQEGALGEGGSGQAGNRDPSLESQDQEGLTQTTTGTVRLTIRRPGGGP